ncbi:MAG: CRISPR-associated protein Cas4 [Candidatus Altiarchaeota archaeon]|nr:CRISPR-associated protein Cas4 [Candidatus Altiarchaeota archaeon]
MIVNASDLSRFEFCPRSVYLTGVLKVSPKPTIEQLSGLVGHYVRKELSFRQSALLGKMKSVRELDVVLKNELDSIASDVPYIYRDRWSGDCDVILPEVKAEVSRELKTLAEKLSCMVDELGFDESLRKLTPWKIEYDVRSDKLGLKGRVDKVMKEDRIVPVEIKTGQPSDTVWEADRIQLCAYCMLIEEKFLENIPSGLVEYTRIQERRPVLATEKLRRKVVHTRDKVIALMEGSVPEICPHGSGRKCESCSLNEECYRT